MGVTDAKDAAKAAVEVKKAAAKGEKDAAEQEAAAAKVDADKEVATAEAEAASTSIKNSGEVETLVKNVKEVASKSVADKAAESSTALASVADETKSTADIARALSRSWRQTSPTSTPQSASSRQLLHKLIQHRSLSSTEP